MYDEQTLDILMCTANSQKIVWCRRLVTWLWHQETSRNQKFPKYKSNDIGFEKKYINLLEAGGSKNYKELLKPFDLDINKKSFWKQSISVVDNLIDELENII